MCPLIIQQSSTFRLVGTCSREYRGANKSENWERNEGQATSFPFSPTRRIHKEFSNKKKSSVISFALPSFLLWQCNDVDSFLVNSFYQWRYSFEAFPGITREKENTFVRFLIKERNPIVCQEMNREITRDVDSSQKAELFYLKIEFRCNNNKEIKIMFISDYFMV